MSTAESSASQPQRKNYSISQYNSAVERLLTEKIPSIWVRGAVMNLQERGRSVYLQLAEFVEGSHKPIAVLDLFLFRGTYESILDRLSREPKPFRLEPGIQISLLIEPNFYIPTGRFQPQIRDIDPSYTLGELARTRLAILKRLAEEGLLQANKQLPLSKAPLRVGLVTALDSAAEHDFRKTVASSHYAVEIITADARMQGPETEKTVVAALQKLRLEKIDALFIIRGGGSKSDLVWFDSEEICRAIATFPVPVLTGIGHEIDRSLADEVAWKDCITPTDSARFLLGQLATAEKSVLDGARILEKVWHLRRLREYQQMELSGVQLRRSVGQISQRERQKLLEMARELAPHFARRSRWERERLQIDAHGLERGSSKILEREKALLKARDEQVKLVDPQRVLERGFALIRRVSTGKSAVAGQFITGEKIEIMLADGVVGAAVESVVPKVRAKE